jgi:hypothetical protein
MRSAQGLTGARRMIADNNHPSETWRRMDHELWRALHAIFDHFFLDNVGRYPFLPRGKKPPDDVVAAVQLLSCRLDVAAEEGWLEDESDA